jgi:dimethylaniline monooxygenase (N-oxide forming)
MTGTKVAVIGGGALGLLALKNLNEDGFDVTCYEARSYIGGLWRSSNDSSLSITQGTTTFNTSKFRGAISDFPFPPEVDDFPTAEQIHAYLESYCDNFRLRNKIELNTRVVGLRRSSTKWVVETLKNEAGSHLNVKYFDKVLVATGTFTSPKTPHIEGMNLFCGPNVHAMRFHDPEQYKGKTVLVVGLHATGQDVTVALSRYASKVYISHKRGLVMVSMYSWIVQV